jgi:microcin C transport system substrate-binding protein
VRTVDSSQYTERIRKFDFDMIVATWGQSLSPGNEQRSFWSSSSADVTGSRNLAGIKDKVVDELVELLIAAPTRRDLVQRTRALDRVLQWKHIVIPQLHIAVDRVIYWNKFSRPSVIPLMGSSFFTWWVDPAKEQALKETGGATPN